MIAASADNIEQMQVGGSSWCAWWAKVSSTVACNVRRMCYSDRDVILNLQPGGFYRD